MNLKLQVGVFSIYKHIQSVLSMDVHAYDLYRLILYFCPGFIIVSIGTSLSPLSAP